MATLLEERRALDRHRAAEWWHAAELSLDEALHRNRGAAYLVDERIASIVRATFAHFDGVRYRLLAWCVMPTHVHVVIKAFCDLSTIVQSWKSFTAKEANRVLGRTGVFWAREYFDRIVRNEEDLSRTIAYVVENPTRAGLGAWEWVWVRDAGQWPA